MEMLLIMYSLNYGNACIANLFYKLCSAFHNEHNADEYSVRKDMHSFICTGMSLLLADSHACVGGRVCIVGYNKMGHRKYRKIKDNPAISNHVFCSYVWKQKKKLPSW